jgi:hypothetical protein
MSATVNTDNNNNNNNDINNNNNNNNRQQRRVTLNVVRDSIISANTYRSYVGDLIQFIKWLLLQPQLMEEWLTDYGRSQLIIIFHCPDDEGVRAHRTRVGEQLKNLLRDAINNPIANIDAITPTQYMEFILQLPKKMIIGRIVPTGTSSLRCPIFSGHIIELVFYQNLKQN